MNWQSASPTIARTPLYFMGANRPVFGWFHASDRPSANGLGLVICPPLGNEYLNSHRSLRHLADQLAMAGMPTLRIDYDGVGDSCGDDEDPERLKSWLDSIRSAINVLRDHSGMQQIGLVGLRMGATLATIVAQDTELACLVLWAPCLSGRAYIRELKVMRLFSRAPNTGHPAGNVQAVNPADSDDIETFGFVYTAATIKDIDRIDLPSLLPKSPRVLIVEQDNVAQKTLLRDSWLVKRINVEQRRLPGYADMLAEPQYTVVPDAAIAEIVDWLAAADAPNAAPDFNPDRKPETLCKYAWRSTGQLDYPNANISETIICFGPKKQLFGILSEPVGKSGRPSPTILLLNPGSVHHVGSSRLYVLLARSLARAGFSCLRFDFSGLGDSFIDAPEQENQPFSVTMSAEIAAAVEALAKQDQGANVVLMGLCSGACAAFHAGLELGNAAIAECILINPRHFYWDAGISPHEPQISFDNLANSCDLGEDIGKLVDQGRRLTFVFSGFESGRNLLTTYAGRTVERLLKEGGVSFYLFERADHTFSYREPRKDLIDTMTRHLAQRYLP